MASKKAAKKSAKKAAKKSAKHHAGKDLRRAYEHLGRLEVLQGGLTAAVVTDINALTQMARARLQAHDERSAADLLRGCEHLAFAHWPQAAAKQRSAATCRMPSTASMST